MPINQSRLEGKKHDSLAYAASLTKKLEDGTYERVPTKCFCGSESYTVLCERERYEIPHRMVVCNDCALMRANPMPTTETYHKIYNDEYRHVNFGVFNDNETDEDGYRRLQKMKGKKLKKLLEDFDIDAPKVVLDVGCHQGGMLDAFKAEGTETCGIEIDAAARANAIAGGHDVAASIDEAAKKWSQKFDFIIVYDVIEHLFDLNDMQKIGKMLKPTGYIYVYTPGIFRCNIDWYFQIAHPWQFCARSLEYVMARLGFEAEYTDEDCVSLWQYVGPHESLKYVKPQEWVEHILNRVRKEQGDVKMPPFRGVCKFSRKMLYSNIKDNYTYKLPDFTEIENSEQGDVVIIAGGPSVNDHLSEIKDLVARGAKTVVINRMYQWALNHNIPVDYVLSLDCTPDQITSFTTINADTVHLLASVTLPEITKKIVDAGAKAYIFDNRHEPKVGRMRAEAGYTKVFIVNAGGCVSITAHNIAWALGFTRLHVFGFDLMFPHGRDETHALGISGTSVPQNVIEATINGETIVTTPSFLDFSRQILDLLWVAHQEKVGESVKYYGDNLINRIWNGKFIDEGN